MFRFGLQKVLEHRKLQENLAQRIFQEALSVLNAEKNKLLEMEKAVTAAHQQRQQTQVHGGKASLELQETHLFLQGQDIRIARQKQRIQECEAVVEEKREILRKAAQEYKIIESLREKKKEAHRVEVDKKEQKKTDDVNIMRFHRGK